MLTTLLQGLAHVMAPNVCRVCGQTLARGEDLMCLKCSLDMPRTGLHRKDFNIVHQRLGHQCRLDKATGWFYYHRGSPYAQMLIDSKYGSQPRLDYKLARMCAAELNADGFFQDIDALVPMPMHWTKKWMRGYNQAVEICRGISAVTGIPVVEALKARTGHGIQARHSREQRFQSISNTLALSDMAEDVENCHVLFVDDIITTGASAIEAIRTLWQASPRAVSALSLGLTI